MPDENFDIIIRLQGARAAAGEMRLVNAEVQRVGRETHLAGQRASGASGHFGKFRGAMGAVATTAKTGALAIAAAATAVGAIILKGAITEWREAVKTQRDTANVIKSTGGAANVTAKQVSQLSSAISAYSGIDDDVIQKGANMLLTFTKIRNEVGKGNDIFNQATKIATDMSVKFGMPISKSAIQIGKALQDPIKGVGALRRVGVMLTESQTKGIKKMVEQGNILGAQKVILKELNTEFGGTAKAQADPLDKLNVAYKKILETIGFAIGPALSDAANWLAKFFQQMQSGKGAGGKFVSVMKVVFEGVKTVVVAAVNIITKIFGSIERFVVKNKKTFEDWGNAIKLIFNKGIVPAFQFVEAVAKRVFPAIITIVRGFANVIGGIINVIAGILTLDFGRAWNGVKQIFSGAIKVILGYLRTVTAPFREVVGRIGSAIASVFRSAWNTVKGIATSGVRAVGTAISGAAGAVARGASSVVSALLGVFKGVGGKILSAIGDVAGNIAGFAKNLVNGIIGMINDVFNAAPHIQIGPVRVGLPKDPLPTLALGGVMTHPGLALVGEAGPEVVSLPRGAAVSPVLPSGHIASGSIAQRASAASSSYTSEAIGPVVENHHHIYIDGKPVFEAVSRENDRRMARK